MGFRVPLTSASSVDTGDTAGVRLFGNAKNPGSGVVEWYVGNQSADATLYSSQTGSGGSSWNVALQNGGPSLALNLEELAQGGYQPVARFAGASFVDFGGASITGAPEVTDYGWQNLTLTNGATTPVEGAHIRRVGQLIDWQAVVQLTDAGYTGTFAMVPDGWQPRFTHWWRAGNGSTDQGEVKIAQGDRFMRINFRPATGSTPLIVCAGSWLL